LDEEATSRDLDGHALTFTGPDEETREAGTTVNGHEVEIVVVVGEDSAKLAVLGVTQVTTSGGQQVRAVLHQLEEDVVIETETDSSHFSDSIDGLHHEVTPGVHVLFPVGEGLGDDLSSVELREVRLGGLFTDTPEEAPLGISLRGADGEGTFVFREFLDLVAVVAGLFDVVRGGTNLVEDFRVDISHLGLFFLFVVLFHLIEEFLVFFFLDTRILDDQDTVLVKQFDDLGAFILPVGVLFLVEKLSDVNNRERINFLDGEGSLDVDFLSFGTEPAAGVDAAPEELIETVSKSPDVGADP